MNFWTEHGTKILGVLTAVLAAFLTLAPETLASVLGDLAPRVVLMVTGALTILRGFQNSAAISRGDFK